MPIDEFTRYWELTGMNRLDNILALFFVSLKCQELDLYL